MKKDDFLVTTTVNGKSWQLVWDQDEALELDHPVVWEVHHGDEGVTLKHRSDGSKYLVEPTYLTGKKDITLPLGKGEFRQVKVNFRPLERLQPAFITTAEAMKAVGPSEHYVSAGIREHLVSFKEFPHKSYIGAIVESNIFELAVSNGVTRATAKIAGLRFKPAGMESKALIPGTPMVIADKDLLNGAFIYGSYWWRVNKVAVPEMLDLDELDKELQSQDLVSLQSLTRGIGVSFLVLLALIRGVYYLSEMKGAEKHEEPKVVEVELKKPKIIQLVEVPKPTPPPPVAVATPPPPPPKPVVVKKEPPKKKPDQKKPEPPKVAKKEPVKAPPPKPQPKVADAPPPKPAVTQPKVAPVPQAPDPSVVAAKQAKESVAKSLNFLSTGPSKTVTALAVNPNAKMSQKYATAGTGAIPASDAAFNKMANANTGDGIIATRGTRNVASNSGIKGGHGKGLNEVQGKVSMNGDYGNGSADALGAAAGGGGMNVSGPGKINDADIERTLAKYVEKFQRCYEKALLSDPSLSGEVQMRWTINTRGQVSGAQVVRSEMNQKALHSCLTGELSKITFPAPKGGDVVVKKPFRFKSSSL